VNVFDDIIDKVVFLLDGSMMNSSYFIRIN